jgi:phage-related minor tail protein
MGWICPLTPLEISLRQQAGQQGYGGGFIEHYILALIYPEGITRGTQIVLAALLIVGNIVVYTLWARRGRRLPA